MSFLPRLRPTCREEGRLPSRQRHAPGPPLNRLHLAGILIADPQEDRGRDGEPVALLLLAFPAPDSRETAEHPETASCEIEVPAAVAARCDAMLSAGLAIVVSGQLTGGGGVIADEIQLSSDAKSR